VAVAVAPVAVEGSQRSRKESSEGGAWILISRQAAEIAKNFYVFALFAVWREIKTLVFRPGALISCLKAGSYLTVCVRIQISPSSTSRVELILISRRPMHAPQLSGLPTSNGVAG